MVQEPTDDGILARWRQVCAAGDHERFDRRLRWDNLTPLGALGTLRAAPAGGVDAGVLVEGGADGEPLPDDAGIPFAELFRPLRAAARRRLREQLGPGAPPMTDAAFDGLERTLVARVVEIAGRTLLQEFSRRRPQGHLCLERVLGSTPSSRGSIQDSDYRAFVAALAADGGLPVLSGRYPLLPRFLADVTHAWIEASAELLTRLSADRGALADGLVPGHQGDPGAIRSIRNGLSDSHHRGRTVATLAFESGLTVVYKPRPLGVEAAWAQLLAWCTREVPDLSPDSPRVLDRGSYGWSEFVEHRSCTDAGGLSRFYVRAGALLSLLHVLGGVDAHFENLVARGEHPLLVDAETVLQPRARALGPSTVRSAPGCEWFERSVLRTGLLRQCRAISDHGHFDPCGLGGAWQHEVRRPQWLWHDVNGDGMALVWGLGETLSVRNMPLFQGRLVPPDGFVDEVVSGFEQMCRFLTCRRRELLGPASALSAFRGRLSRFLFRETRIYLRLLDRAFEPALLRDGAAWGIELDALSRAFLHEQHRPAAWPVLRAECDALHRLDVPRFEVASDETDLRLDGGGCVSDFFEVAPLAEARSRLEALDETEILRQVAIVRTTFPVRPGPVPTGGSWIEEAVRIGRALEADALRSNGGRCDWLGLDGPRLDIRPLGWGLYDGRTGVALFLAALAAATGERRWAELARGAIGGMCEELTEAHGTTVVTVRAIGIGGGNGLGGLVYAFTAIGRFLRDAHAMEAASAAAAWITHDLVEQDVRLDVIGGSAGAVLGLLSLFRETGEARALEMAVACGERLLARHASPNGPRGWGGAPGSPPLTGFAHGAAGIAFALTRLHRETGDSRLLDAAAEGVAYETSVFSRRERRWPDFRSEPPAYLDRWCHGTAGIGLGRLGMLPALASPGILADIRVALDAVGSSLSDVDTLCCGSFGGIDLLLHAAAVLGSETSADRARARVAATLERAGHEGGYRLLGAAPGPCPRPGLFQGLAGVGYGLLRAALPATTPSVLLMD